MTIKSTETPGTRKSRSLQKEWRPSPESDFDETPLTNSSTPLGEVASDSGHQSRQKNEEDEATAAEKLTLSGLDAAENERRSEAEIGRQDTTRL